MPSPIRGCGNIGYEHNVMVSHVHRARYRLADLVSLTAFLIYPWHRLTGLVVELLSTAPRKRNSGSRLNSRS